ncbi:MAG: hypothetical protein KDB61_14095, partial [Planctomycetes bacterium]|nr:hypothetical protein [Planctomycetota bacterium]
MMSRPPFAHPTRGLVWLCLLVFLSSGLGLGQPVQKDLEGAVEQVLMTGEALDLGGDNGERLLWKGGRFAPDGSFFWSSLDWVPGTELSATSIQEGGVSNAGIPESGSCWSFQCKNGAWGYVRVLGVGEDWMRVESLRVADAKTSVSIPAKPLGTAAEPEGYRLTWQAPKGVEYRVLRAVVG